MVASSSLFFFSAAVNFPVPGSGEVQGVRGKQAGAGKASRFTGVTRRGNRWQAEIKVDGTHRHLGTFDTEEEAASA